MFTRLTRLALLCLFSLLTTGCWVFGFGFGRAVRVPPGGPPNAPPTPVIPQIQLEYGGTSVTGVESYYNWQTNNMSMSGGGGVAPGSANTRLTVPAGHSVNIVISLAPPPAVLWVAELDSQGAPTKTAALTPASPMTPYPLTLPGNYKLQVMAEWTYQQQVTYIFDLDVTP